MLEVCVIMGIIIYIMSEVVVWITATVSVT